MQSNKLKYPLKLLILLIGPFLPAHSKAIKKQRRHEPPVIYPIGYFDQRNLAHEIFEIIPENKNAQLRTDDDQWMNVDYEVSLGKNSNPNFFRYIHSRRHRLTYELLQDIYIKNHPLSIQPSPHFIIPPIIHQIWLGGQPPAAFEELQQTIFDNHPGWYYKLWRDEDVKKLKLVNQRYFDNAHNYGEKSDILRLELLNIFGGWYLDWDMRSIKSLEPLGRRYEFCIGNPGIGDQVWVCNAILGSVSKQPILKHAIETIRNHRHYIDIPFRTGPMHMTKSFKAVAKKCSGPVIALPTNFFYPALPASAFTLSLEQIENATKPETFVVHYWGATWTH